MLTSNSRHVKHPVIPAKAGIRVFSEIPAFAGMTAGPDNGLNSHPAA